MIKEEDVIEVARRTLQRTVEKKIEWYCDDEGDPCVAFPRSSVVVYSDGEQVGFLIRNLEGDVVGRILMNLDDTDTAKNYEVVTLLSKLYSVANRSIYKYDETLEDVLKGLSGDPSD